MAKKTRRGQKQCPACNKWIKGTRAKECLNCGHQFNGKQKAVRPPSPKQLSLRRRRQTAPSPSITSSRGPDDQGSWRCCPPERTAWPHQGSRRREEVQGLGGSHDGSRSGRRCVLIGCLPNADSSPGPNPRAFSFGAQPVDFSSCEAHRTHCAA